MQVRKTVPLPGTERKPVRGARVKGPIDGDEPIEVRITLKAPASLSQKADDLARQPLDKRQYLSREDFEKNYGLETGGVEKIEQFARDHNLSVSHIDRAQQAVYLSGNARDV